MKVTSQIKPLMRWHAEDTPDGKVRMWITAVGATQEEITMSEDAFNALAVNCWTLAQHIEAQRAKVAA